MDFECDCIGDTGGKIEQSQCLSQEVRGKKLLNICVYFSVYKNLFSKMIVYIYKFISSNERQKCYFILPTKKGRQATIANYRILTDF